MTTWQTGEELPLTFLVPDSFSLPVVIEDSHSSLVMAIVERENALSLDDDWDSPGVYILFDAPEPSGAFGCYVGKATLGAKKRLREHLQSKEYWRRAIVIRRQGRQSFTSAHVGWLEGRLYDLLAAASMARLHNGNRPSDETLPLYDRRRLENVLEPVIGVLRILGYATFERSELAEGSRAADPLENSVTQPPVLGDVPAGDLSRVSGRRRTSKYNGISLRTLADAGLLEAGWALRSDDSERHFEGAVGPNGVLQLLGHEWKNPSPPAAQATGTSRNGWTYWWVKTPRGEMPLSDLRDEYLLLRGQ